MDRFESQTENLDVAANAMDQSMGNATTLSTPADQVGFSLTEMIFSNKLSIRICTLSMTLWVE